MRIAAPAESLSGWVAVDSLVDGFAMGGTRMTPSVTEPEVRDLARTMTVKLGLAGLRAGGAKAGIRSVPGRREGVLRAFGRAVTPLLHGGVYLGCDQGTTHGDRDLFFAEAGYDVRRLPRVTRLPTDWPTLWRHVGDITGFGVVTGALTALGKESRQRVSIQGFGTVGRAVASQLAAAGHQIVAVADILGTVAAPGGLPVAKLVEITDPAGTIDRARLPEGVAVHGEPEAWLDADADMLVLAAGGDALREDNVARVRAGLVIEGGNLCVTPAAQQLLRSAGRTVVPGVVVNVGGAAVTGCILTGVAPSGLPLGQLTAWLFDWVGACVRRNTADLLEIAAASDGDPVPELLAARRPERRR